MKVIKLHAFDMYCHDKAKIEKVATVNNMNIRDVLSELIEFGLEKMMDENGWEQPQEEEE